MLQKKFRLSTEQISKEVSHFTIGFARLIATGKVEDAVSAGSGTLVTIGKVHGVLTAAHVIADLPKSGPVGIIMHADDASRFDKQRIAMEYAVPVVIRADTFNSKGPDLAFLRLPPDSVGWIAAKGSFYNLRKHRDDVLNNREPTPSNVHSLTGIIHEFTQDAPGGNATTRRKIFTAIFCGARLAALRYFDKHQLYYFELTNDPGFALPQSFEGTSGGSAWRFYVAEKDNAVTVVERRLVGVPFYQSLDPDGKRIITCHAARDIYGALVDSVAAKWPDEAAS
jgi:hypothetical protein